MGSQHLICLTIDTDPDGLSTQNPDRKSLAWDGLHFAIEEFHAALTDIPLTWYVRADGQIEQAYGSVTYLFEQHRDFWDAALGRGDELGWHPHLYTIEEEPQIIRESGQAVHELRRIHEKVQEVPFPLPTFRMGEGWHTPQTLNLIEEMGFGVDSTAIPGRDDSATGHPRNWAGTPNQPYFPATHDIRIAGEQRLLLEAPMNSWYIQASYDAAPRLRYMNPCVHQDLWEQGLDWWEDHIPQATLYIWDLILHPIEAMPQPKSDLLYAYSLQTLRENLDLFVQRIEERGDTALFTTLARAAHNWREAIL